MIGASHLHECHPQIYLISRLNLAAFGVCVSVRVLRCRPLRFVKGILVDHVGYVRGSVCVSNGVS